MARKVSDKYRRRVSAVRGYTHYLREAARKDLKEGLQKATDEQLYNVTPLPATGAMYDSIGTRLRGDIVEVGYSIGEGKKVKHPPYRLQMKGRYVRGRGRKDMNPSKLLIKYATPKLRRRNARAQKGIIGD